MNKRYLIKAILSAAVVSTAVLSTPASASGFLVDLGVASGIITPDQGRVLDGWHRDLGQPLDQLNPFNQQIAYGSNCYVPGQGYFPGPMNPVGSPCYVNGMYGPMSGNVTQ